MPRIGAPKGNKYHLIHGLSHTRIDNIYKNMKLRCYYPKHNRYKIMVGEEYVYVMNGLMIKHYSFNGRLRIVIQMN